MAHNGNKGVKRAKANPRERPGGTGTTVRHTGSVIELRAGQAHCVVSPSDGGRIASLAIGARELLISKPEDGNSMTWGSFVMAPWAGRIRNGAFRFNGNQYQLDLGLPPHAIHGTVYTQPWTVGDIGPTFVSMSCPLGDQWPFGGVVHQRIELDSNQLRCTVSISADELEMPAQVGWHPWFRKPDTAQFEFAQMYRRDASGIPDGQLITPPAGPWDDCFVSPLSPIQLHYADLTVTVDSDCDHWVIYDQPSQATCVEPQSGPPDGVNLRPDRLLPGEMLQRQMTIEWHVLHVGETVALATEG